MSPRLVASLIAASALAFVARNAGAQEARVDPLVTPGAVLTSTGAGLSIAGMVMSAVGKGATICGVAGCFDRPGRQWDVYGGALLGSGMGLIGLGAPTLLVGLGRTTPADAMVDNRLRQTGIGLTSTGVALVGAGIGALAVDGAHLGVGTQGAVIAIPSLAVGAGFVISGAIVWSRVGRKAEPPPLPEVGPPLHYSDGMMYAGITCTVLGVVTVIGGVVTIASIASQRGDFAGLAAAVTGGSIAGGGLLLTSVGGVLWGLGARRMTRSQLQTLNVPTVRVGPASAELTWRF